MTTPLLTLWQRGIRLNKAPYSYAPKEDKAEYKRLHETSAITAFSDAMTRMQETGRSGVDAMSEAFSEPQQILSARAKWDDRMRKFILHHLTQGNLFAYGFEPPRKMDSQPVEILPAYWRGHIRWDKASLTVQGLEFVEIRIVLRQLRDEVLNRKKIDLTPPQPAGRPTVGPSVKAAFAALHKAGEIDVTASQQSHYPKIRSWMELNVPNLSVPASEIADQTLQKHFSPLFNSLKKSSKL